jgi:cytochrome b561
LVVILWISGQTADWLPHGPLNVYYWSTHVVLGFALALVIVIGLGITNAFVRGYNLFDLVSVPQLGDKALRKPITHWHGLAANILLGLAGLHAAAALFHHYVLRDSVLGRMVWAREV